MPHDPYEFEPPIGTPAEHRARRAYLFQIYETVPVPPGARDLPDSTKRADNEVLAADGSIIRYYVVESPDSSRIYATLDHPEGYAEFVLRADGEWFYLAAPRVVYSGLISLWEDEYDASKVEVDPPTLAMANEQASKNPELNERARLQALAASSLTQQEMQ